MTAPRFRRVRFVVPDIDRLILRIARLATARAPYWLMSSISFINFAALPAPRPRAIGSRREGVYENGRSA